MVSQLCGAVSAKQIVALRRQGDPSERIVEPHVVYEAKNGNILVDFYQTDGHSSSGRLPTWRQLKVEDIVSIRTLTDHFDARYLEGYNPQNKDRYTRIICMV